jgi:hypothetical protein
LREWPLGGSARRRFGREPVDALLPADLHAVEMSRSTINHGDGAGAQSEHRPALVFDECDGGETFEDRLVVGVRRNGGEIDALALRVGPDVTDKLTGPSVK